MSLQVGHKGAQSNLIAVSIIKVGLYLHAILEPFRVFNLDYMYTYLGHTSDVWPKYVYG